MLSLYGSANNATIWSWTGPGGFTSSLQNPVIQNIQLSQAGVYTLTASNEGCVAPVVYTRAIVVNPVSISNPVGININIYPNPAGKYFVFEFVSESGEKLKKVDLYNNAGVFVENLLGDLNDAKVSRQIDLKSLPDVLLTLVISTGKRMYVKKLSIMNNR